MRTRLILRSVIGIGEGIKKWSTKNNETNDRDYGVTILKMFLFRSNVGHFIVYYSHRNRKYNKTFYAHTNVLLFY